MLPAPCFISSSMSNNKTNILTKTELKSRLFFSVGHRRVPCLLTYRGRSMEEDAQPSNFITLYNSFPYKQLIPLLLDGLRVVTTWIKANPYSTIGLCVRPTPSTGHPQHRSQCCCKLHSAAKVGRSWLQQACASGTGSWSGLQPLETLREAKR